MTKLIDETGNVYGKLTVIEQGKSTPGGNVRWLCKCTCGREALVIGQNLRRGNTRSCACGKGRWDHKLPSGEASFNRYFTNIQWHANKRGYEFRLTKEQVKQITKNNCYYCGKSPEKLYFAPGCNGPYIGNGLDRVDNELGYTLNNVVACCEACNRAKLQRSKDEFIAWAHRIADHHPNSS